MWNTPIYHNADSHKLFYLNKSQNNSLSCARLDDFS